MNDKSAIAVAEAQARILAAVPSSRPVESVPLARAWGRTLARDLAAIRTQPPHPVSAMDGYAVRAADLVNGPVRLHQIGESAAGRRFSGSIGAGETIRIFTGATVPDGADAILIQEDARVEAGSVEPRCGVDPGQFIRPAGLDFKAGDVLLRAGTRLGPAAIALAAAMNHAELPVVRRPRVGILATGDELVPPGTTVGPDQIVASNGYGIAVLVESAGGEAFDLGVAHDNLGALAARARAAIAAECDVLVTSGGASVGDHDLVKPALARAGMELDFWRVALRPGKPLLHGGIGSMAILGLPGNPVSALVSGVLFLIPLVRALSGDPLAARDRSEPATLGAALRANDGRQDYLRATLAAKGEGLSVATPFENQDSSMLSVLAGAHCLVIRPPHAPAAEAGDLCRILRLPC
jgi:molybdopterin molybdotransferase